MTKNEYIAKYGEEKYRQHLAAVRERMRNKYREKGNVKIRDKSSSYYSVDFLVPEKEGFDADEMAYHFQRMLKRQWAKDYGGDSIIIVEQRNRKDGNYRFKAELYLTKSVDNTIKQWFKDCIWNLEYENN